MRPKARRVPKASSPLPCASPSPSSGRALAYACAGVARTRACVCACAFTHAALGDDRELHAPVLAQLVLQQLVGRRAVDVHAGRAAHGDALDVATFAPHLQRLVETAAAPRAGATLAVYARVQPVRMHGGALGMGCAWGGALDAQAGEG
eukprot:6173240-Pleurochrysis_carterae.AAC.13